MIKYLPFLLYSVYLLLLVIFSYQFIDPNLMYFHSFYSGFAYIHRYVTAMLYAGFILIAFILYMLLLRAIEQRHMSLKTIIFLLSVTGIFLIAAYPAMLSYDIFNYIATAKVAFYYHENPYIIMPVSFIGEPLLQFMHAANKTALYGPLWILLTAIPGITGYKNFVLVLFAMKLLQAFFYSATVFLIWLITKNKYAVAFFGLNPLVCLESLLSSHNDMSMIFLCLLAYYFLKKSNLLSLSFLILSVCIKFVSIILLPLFIAVLFFKIPISREKFILLCALLLFGVFLLAPFREEIYPWYSIWFLSFLTLSQKQKTIQELSIWLTAGLLCSYIPYMYSGTYAGATPLLKIICTWSIPAGFLCITGIKKYAQKNNTLSLG